MRLVERRALGLAVGGARRREHQAAHPRLDQGLEQGDALGDVVPVVPRRLLHRLPHVGQGGEVDAFLATLASL